MPIMMINGEFFILDDDYKLDFEKSIRNTIMNTLLHYTMKFNFNYDNTKELVESLTNKILRTIEFHKEQEKLQNQSSTSNCPSCNSDLVQEEGHEFGDPDGEETGIIDHFHCLDCGQDFLKDGTKLVKHSETSLVAKEDK